LIYKFADDTFTLNKKRVMEFCKNKRNDVPFGANAHVKTVDEEMISALASAGCEELWLASRVVIAVSDQSIGKNITTSEILSSFYLSKKYGIRTRAYFLLVHQERHMALSEILKSFVILFSLMLLGSLCLHHILARLIMTQIP